MKVAVSPRVTGRLGTNLTVEYPAGTINFASYERIVRGMKQGGEMPEDWNIIGVVLEPDGIAFQIGPKENKK